jgi:MFS family permease
MFGYILSLNAAMVVLFQFPITRWISKYRPLMVMVAGTFLYAIGFSMYGYVSIYPLFLLAMVIITVGEMLVSPVSQSIVAGLAPEEMRGRYMATYGFSWVLPTTIGPLLAGLVMDNLDPRWVWYAGGFIALAATAAFYLLEEQVGKARWALIDQRVNIMEQLENGEITAEDAAARLSAVPESKWAKLSSQVKAKAQQQVHIRLSDAQSGSVHKDLSIPVGLVNIILNTDCRLSIDIDESVDPGRLRELLSHSLATHSAASLESTGSQRVDISLDPPQE